MSSTDMRIAVIGLGLIGASFTAAYKQKNPESTVLGVDVLPSTREAALGNGWVDQACDPQDGLLESFVRDRCDLVIIATPIPEVDFYFDRLGQWGYEGIVTDTASAKAHVISAAEEGLGEKGSFIPGHPMAGSEVNGIEGARSDLFEGAYWILCPDEDTDPDHFRILHETVTGLGARVISLPREDHDDAVAIVSHVPHIIASSLVELATSHADEQQSLFRLAAGGFKDSTRIAAGSPELWCGIVFDNARALEDGLDEMRTIIGRFSDALAAGDRKAMTALLKHAADARRSLPAAWVPSTEKLLEVRIPMQDRKGVVAEATTIASQAGCNIQSIDIDHVTESSAVLSLVLTDEGDIGQLSTQLINAGFAVSFSPLSPKEHTHVQ